MCLYVCVYRYVLDFILYKYSCISLLQFFEIKIKVKKKPLRSSAWKEKYMRQTVNQQIPSFSSKRGHTTGKHVL